MESPMGVYAGVSVGILWLIHDTIAILKYFIYLFIYLAAPGLTCDMQDL